MFIIKDSVSLIGKHRKSGEAAGQVIQQCCFSTTSNEIINHGILSTLHMNFDQNGVRTSSHALKFKHKTYTEIKKRGGGSSIAATLNMQDCDT